MMPQVWPPGAGWIEVVTGCMFSGKTSELIHRLERAQLARSTVAVFKPARDVRYGRQHIVTHSNHRFPSIAVDKAAEILQLAAPYEVVGVDEAQFFDLDLVRVCNRLADEGKRVVVAGLDQDFRGEPFEPIPQLMAVAEYVTKKLAVCTVCGLPADRSQRLVPADERFLLGARGSYEARCRRHWSAEVVPVMQGDLPLGEPDPVG
ncbi:MAG: thymidine kinase [Deltaproteobacteria bacterium]|nr:thymidine kinase [Deltaproteobacteria bacterium]